MGWAFLCGRVVQGNLNLILEDVEAGQGHDGVLGQLLGIVGGSLALENDSFRPHEQAETTDSPGEPSFHQDLKAMNFRGN